jgi:hypothetical protein
MIAATIATMATVEAASSTPLPFYCPGRLVKTYAASGAARALASVSESRASMAQKKEPRAPAISGGRGGGLGASAIRATILERVGESVERVPNVAYQSVKLSRPLRLERLASSGGSLEPTRGRLCLSGHAARIQRQ